MDYIKNNQLSFKEFLRYVIGMIILCAISYVFAKAQESLPITTQPIIFEFEQYRIDTIKLLEIHKQNHKACFLTHLPISNLSFAFSDSINSEYRAYVDLEEVNDTKYIIFNSNYIWDRKQAIITIIHESLHVHKICGKDNPKRISKNISACNLFGLEMYNSQDITFFLKDHLRKELNNLNKK